MRIKSDWVGVLFGLFANCAGAAHVGAQDDLAAAGEKIFNSRCQACHSAGEGEKSRVGPNLFGVWEQPAGARDDFRYSKRHRESGAIWDEATLDLYLEDVSQVVPNPIKRFSGLSDPDERAAVIAYLISRR